MPFRLDAYRGCPARCIYCFVNSRNGNYSQKTQYADPFIIRRLFNIVLGSPIRPRNVIMECIRKRMPLHFGGISDPFLISKGHQYITIDILKTLDSYKYPTLISTKANLLANKEFLKIILGKPHFALQISFSTFNDGLSRILEPNAPPPSERLKGAKFAAAEGNWVACRLQPYFPGQNAKNLVSFISKSGFHQITIEHFKLPFDGTVNIHPLNSCFKTDLLRFFQKRQRIKRGREFEMPNEIRLKGISEFIDAANLYKIPIGIGDNGFQHMSSSLCCCGIDSLPGFENWFKHNMTVAVKRFSVNKAIKYETISDEWAPELNISRMINSKTRLRKTVNTVRTQIKTQWERNGQLSPAMFYNVVSKRSGKGYEYFIN
jgi:DNA repair photolyase